MKKLLFSFVLMSFTVLYAGQGSVNTVGKAVVYIENRGMVSCDLVVNPRGNNYKVNLIDRGQGGKFRITDYSYKNIDYYEFKMKIDGRPYGGTIKVSNCYLYFGGALNTIVLKKDCTLAAMTRSAKTFNIKAGSVITFNSQIVNSEK